MTTLSAPPPAENDLFALFAGELASATPRLQELVLSLEVKEGRRDGEEAMRLAHSLKGAARITGLLALVEALHAAEDTLTAAQGKVLATEDAQTLLELVDRLDEVSRIPADRIRSFVLQRQSAFSEIAGNLRRRRHTKDSAKTERTQVSAGGPPAEAFAPTVPPVPGMDSRKPSREPSSQPASQPGNQPSTDARGVRVGAESLTRLLGLAGEAVVEARRLGTSGRSGLALERIMHRLEERTLELRERARASGDTQLSTFADAAREDLSQMSALITKSRETTTDGLERLTDIGERLYIESLRARQRPFAQLVPGLRRLFRDTTRSLDKSAKLDVLGASTLVDGDVLAAMEPILHHLLTNAIDHGIDAESARMAAGKPSQATVTVELRHARGALALTVTDDGRGIDPERLRNVIVSRGHADDATARALSRTEIFDFLFLPGFSTAGGVSVHSGRGVGLDVVHTEVTKLGGQIAVESELGAFTRFDLALPVTRVVVPALLIRVAGESYALPLARAGRVVRVPASEIHNAEGRDYVQIDGENVGLVHADELLDVGRSTHQADDLTLVLLGDADGRYGLVVDAALGEDDLVVRPLDPRLGRVPDVAATAILADGAPTLLLDGEDLLRSIDKLTRIRRPTRTRTGTTGTDLTAKRLLVVDDSATVREAERQMLARRGFIVDVAIDGVDAWDMLRARRYDLAVVDLDMPRMNGFELIRRIRRDHELATLPVIIVSYKDRDEDRVHGLEVGANHFLVKGSFQEDELIRTVHGLVGDSA